MPLFKVSSEGKIAEFKSEGVRLEEILQDWIEESPKLLLDDEKLLVIGREVPTESGSIDLLATDRYGDLVVVELKRGMSPREVVAQALDYLTIVQFWDGDKIQNIASEYFRANESQFDSLEGAFQDAFGVAFPQLNKRQRIVIAAEEIAPNVERMCNFLNAKGIPITCLEFKSYKTETGEKLLDVSRKVMQQPRERGPMTEKEFLEACEKPGRILYHRLKELTAERGHEIRWTRYAFGYYMKYKGKPFCLFSDWPLGISILKWNLTTTNGVSKEATETFRREMAKIGTLEGRYDVMKQPSLSTEEGSLSPEEIEVFVRAVAGLDDSIRNFKNAN